MRTPLTTKYSHSSKRLKGTLSACLSSLPSLSSLYLKRMFSARLVLLLVALQQCSGLRVSSTRSVIKCVAHKSSLSWSLRPITAVRSTIVNDSATADGTAKNKKKMAKIVVNGVLSYGFVSNVSYITCLIISWITHGRRTGLSPLAPGQWKGFLTIYAALWAANNILRPARFTVAVALAPLWERLIDLVQKKTEFKRATCTGIVVFAVNVCGTLSYMIGGLLIATSIARVPLLP